MGFFDIGMWEFLLILVIILIIFGPGSLPDVARTLGKTVREIKKFSSALTKDFREEFEREVRATPDMPKKSSKRSKRTQHQPKVTLTKDKGIKLQNEKKS